MEVDLADQRGGKGLLEDVLILDRCWGLVQLPGDPCVSPMIRDRTEPRKPEDDKLAVWFRTNSMATQTRKIFTYQLSFWVSGAISIFFPSFSGRVSAPHPLTWALPHAIGTTGRSYLPRSAILKTSARSELCLRFAGLSVLAGSSTRESTLVRVSAVSAAIVMVEQRIKAGGWG